jgi:alanine racemase
LESDIKTYSISHIAEVLKVKQFVPVQDTAIKELLTDSRTIIDPEGSLFFAVPADRDGHSFIAEAHANGIRNFVISEAAYLNKFADANYLLVENVLDALQQLAAFRRSQFDLKTIAITGSNGKTIVKEWLYQLLASDYNVVKSPKSFNSQIGVPLSVWQIEPEHTLGIFEAGISRPQEMDALEQIIRPQIGILTNIGAAHAEGFSSPQEKLLEKLKLFEHAELFIYSPDYTAGVSKEQLPALQHFSWSFHQLADLQIVRVEPLDTRTQLHAQYQGAEINCLIPFRDQAAIENGVICWATLLAMGYTPAEAKVRLEKLNHVRMRLELKTGINQCSVIDDSYSADISSLAIALDFLNLQNQHPTRTLILSDLYETGKNEAELYVEIAALIRQKNVDRLIGIGPAISRNAPLFELDAIFYPTAAEFMDAFPSIPFHNESILIKGARRFEFERISKLLTQKIHDTVMEINLNAVAGNLKFYKAKLSPGVKIMAMVKAFSYGSGSFEIANVLQYHKVDYLAVAYTDEGIALRRSGIDLPIMVMSPEPSAFEAIVKYKLEPELYNKEILQGFLAFLPQNTVNYPVHIKIDTGMHRLGFEELEVSAMIAVLKQSNKLRVKSAFSHLVASDDEAQDAFTRLQIATFKSISSTLSAALGYSFIRHISNTSAISRHPEAQLDMVRVGIGLYGFDGALPNTKGLQAVASLKTTVTQVKHLHAGDTVGYSRRGVMPQDGSIATVKIGYADGYSRMFGNGVGHMLINGKPVPTIGSICMDMCMLNVTGLDVKNGDEVIVFNEDLTISELARQVQTIPYEILTNISQRVKRVYFYE